MTKREVAALRRSMWKGVREAITARLEPSRSDYARDIWNDEDREWSGAEVEREASRIAARARSAVLIAERRMREQG